MCVCVCVCVYVRARACVCVCARAARACVCVSTFKTLCFSHSQILMARALHNEDSSQMVVNLQDFLILDCYIISFFQDSLR